MITSRRFAGHSSNESRVTGNGRRPPSEAIWVNFMHLLTVRYAVLPFEFVAGVPQRYRRLRALRRAHQLEVVDPGNRRIEESEAVLAPLDLQGRVGGAVHREDVTDEAVVGEMLVEGLAPPFRMRLTGCWRPGNRPAGRECPGEW